PSYPPPSPASPYPLPPPPSPAPPYPLTPPHSLAPPYPLPPPPSPSLPPPVPPSLSALYVPPSPYAPYVPPSPYAPYVPPSPYAPYMPPSPYAPYVPPSPYAPPYAPSSTYVPPLEPHAPYSSSPPPPTPVLYLSPPPSPSDGTYDETACSARPESQVKFFITMDIAYEDVSGNTQFINDLQEVVERNVMVEFGSLILHRCPDFIQVILTPGSTVGNFQADLGDDASVDTVSAFQEGLRSMDASDVERRLLKTEGGTTLTVDGQEIKVIGISASINAAPPSPRPPSPIEDAPPQTTDLNTNDDAEVLGPAIAVPVFIFLVLVGTAVFWVVRKSKERDYAYAVGTRENV
ncbi:hypothetical protein DUNSADRAFT_8047, partial [Dunaliella salina]